MKEEIVLKNLSLALASITTGRKLPLTLKVPSQEFDIGKAPLKASL
jgi:hypothetical protein